MLNNLSDTEQEEAELRYLFGEALSEYLQGYAYEQGPPAFDTLETASLNLGDDTPRQGFQQGGFTGIGAAPEAAVSLGLNVALGANPVSIALGLANLGVAIGTGKTISEQIGLTPDLFSSPTGLIGQLPIEIENPATGQITTLSGRQAIQDSERGTPDPTFGSGPPTGFLGTGGTNLSTVAIDVEQAPATVSQAAEASDPAADAAVAAGQGVAPGGAATTSGQDAVGATGTGATGAASESGFGASGTSGSESGIGPSPGADVSSSTGEDVSGFGKDGGQIKGYRQGDLVETDQADTQLDGLGLGPLGVINDPDGTTGVADDLDMDLPVGSYVLNEEAVKLTGVVSVNKMIKEAIDLAIEDGVDLPKEIKASEKIPIRISQGEGAIPNPLVDYIGLKKLENMNNRGLKVRKQRESEEAPVEMAAAPSPQEDLLAQIQPVA